jgi:hypothetical protein
MGMTQYYGADWIATVLSVASVWMLGSRRRNGFLVMIAGNGAWMAYGLLAPNVPIILSNVVFAVLNLRGYMSWCDKPQEA